MNILLLLIGFIFTFFVPGLVIIQVFFPSLPRLIKLPLCLLLSILVSTHTIYYFSLLIGFSKISILSAFSLFLPGLVYVLLQRHKFTYPLSALLLSLLISLIFFIALWPAIFTRHADYIVMAGVNWQDTANHLGIIESFTQGNFPPQAPYYSGVPLSYYILTDFHTAILSTLYGHFFPRVLVYDNSLLVLTFCLTLYALGYTLTRQRLTSTFTVILGVFNGNLMFLHFLRDALHQPLVTLLTNNSYHHEHAKLIQVTPMTDYLLQNRPMIVGLPGAALGGLLIYLGFKNTDFKLIILAGVFTGMLLQFQSFAALSIGLACVIAFATFTTQANFKTHLKYFLIFILLLSLFTLPFLASPVRDHSVTTMIKESFSFGPFDHTKDLLWYLNFYIQNFGLSLILALSGIVLLFKRKKEFLFVQLWFLSLFLIPNLVRFTVFHWDMFKFYYLMTIPMVVIASLALNKLWKSRSGPFVVILILITCSFTSFLILANSFLNKNFAYSLADYQTGLWIRYHTPQQSVFLSMPTVHDPPTQIGGRLRVLSYINWPYSHGYNTGPDNVFSRLDDIQSFYQNPSITILKRYHVTYVYYGPEERTHFPQAELALDHTPFLKSVHTSPSIKIYEVTKSL